MRKTGVIEEIYHINQKSGTKDLISLQLCGITFPDKSYKIVRDRSKVACIEFVESGCGSVTIDGKTFYPGEGDSYFLQAGKDQYYFSDRDTPWKKYFINFSGALAESLTEGYGLSGVYYFKGLDLKDELCRIIELARGEYDDSTPEIITIINQMMLKMHDHMKSRAEKPGIEREMKDFLGTRITQSFNLEGLCKHISRSESQTIRIFKKAYGITPYKYVLNKKIDLAKKLLDSTNLTVKNISEKLCFSDEYYFSNLFKSKVGVSPVAYRKRGEINKKETEKNARSEK